MSTNTRIKLRAFTIIRQHLFTFTQLSLSQPKINKQADRKQLMNDMELLSESASRAVAKVVRRPTTLNNLQYVPNILC